MKLYNSNLAPEARAACAFSWRQGRLDSTRRGRSRQARAQDAGILHAQSVETIPILELDDGTRIAELIAICRYIEALWPEPNLFGLTPVEQAMIEMWQRQLELRLLLPIAQVLRHTHPRMAEMENPQVPDWAAANRPRALHAMAIVDETLKRPAVHRRRPAFPSPTSPASWRSTSPSRRASRSRPSSSISTAGTRP